MRETFVNFDQIASRLSLLVAIWTPKKMYRNDIRKVGTDSVTVFSSKPGSQERTIRFQDILDGTTYTNGCIIASFRQILGLQTDPQHGGEDDE